MRLWTPLNISTVGTDYATVCNHKGIKVCEYMSVYVHIPAFDWEWAVWKLQIKALIAHVMLTINFLYWGTDSDQPSVK